MTPAGAPAVHLIDASYFVFRAWYSVGLEMTDGDGQPVNALYGFGRFLGDLLEEARPEHVAEVGAYADAAVVGSALVSLIAEASGSPQLIGRVDEYVRSLRAACVAPRA